MVAIDIPISPDVQKAFDLTPCDVIKLPFPKPLSIELPSGGSMKSLVDVSKGIPNDCAMSFNLLLQLQPLLIALECPLRVLKLLKPLVDIIKDLPKPPPPKLLTDFGEAAVELAPCFTSLAAIPKFVLDILCLLRAILNCLVGQLRTVRDLMQGIALQMAAAEGNPDLQATLQCAQENAEASMANIASAIDPLAAFLAILSPIMGIAGMDVSIELVPPVAGESDLAAIDALIASLELAVDAIDTATGGACGG